MADKTPSSQEPTPTIVTVSAGSSIPVSGMEGDKTYGIGGPVAEFSLTAQHGHNVAQISADALIPHRVTNPADNHGLTYALESIPQADIRGSIGRVAKVETHGVAFTAYASAGVRKITNLAPSKTAQVEDLALSTLREAIDKKDAAISQINDGLAKIDTYRTTIAQLPQLARQQAAPQLQALAAQATTLQQSLKELNAFELPEYGATKERLDAALTSPKGLLPYASVHAEISTDAHIGKITLRPFAEAGGEIGTQSKAIYAGVGLTIGKNPDGLPNPVPSALPFESATPLTMNPPSLRAGDWQLIAAITRYHVTQDPRYASELLRSDVTVARAAASVAVSDHVTAFVNASYGDNPSQGLDLPSPFKGLKGTDHVGKVGGGVSVKF